MENNVIDLGTSVSKFTFLEAIREETICVCLSGLMTPSIKEMEETIKLIKSKYPKMNCVVGGAVINKKIAQIINADYYSSKAFDILDIIASIKNKKGV